LAPAAPPLAATSGVAGAGVVVLGLAEFGTAEFELAGLGLAELGLAAFGPAVSGLAVVPGVDPVSGAFCEDCTVGVSFRKLNPPCCHRKYPNPPIKPKAITTRNNFPQPRFGSSSSSSK
jgi:hypothetical protein